MVEVENPTNLPPQSEIDFMEEPIVRAFLYTPPEYVGTIMELCQDKRGVYKSMEYIDETRVNIHYEIPFIRNSL